MALDDRSARNLDRAISEGRGALDPIAGSRALSRQDAEGELWEGTTVLTQNCVHTPDPRLRRYGIDGTTGQGDSSRKYGREQCIQTERPLSRSMNEKTSNVNVNLEVRDWWAGITMAIWVQAARAKVVHDQIQTAA